MKLWVSLNKEGPFEEKDGYKYDILYKFINDNKLSFGDCFYLLLEDDSYLFKYEIAPFDGGVYGGDNHMYLENKDSVDDAILVKQESNYLGNKEMILSGTIDDTSSCGCCDASFSITKDGFCIYDHQLKSVDSFLSIMKSFATNYTYNECLNVLKKMGKNNV